MKRTEIETILNNAELDNAAKIDQIMGLHGRDTTAWNQDKDNLIQERDNAIAAGNAHADYDQIVQERDALKSYKADREIGDRFSAVVNGARFKNSYTENGVRNDFVKAIGDEANQGKTDAEIYAGIVNGHESEYYEGQVKIYMPAPKAQEPKDSFQAYADEKYKDSPWYRQK